MRMWIILLILSDALIDSVGVMMFYGIVIFFWQEMAEILRKLRQ